MLNRAATFPSVSFRSPPVTCDAGSACGRPCRKKKRLVLVGGNLLQAVNREDVTAVPQ